MSVAEAIGNLRATIVPRLSVFKLLLFKGLWPSPLSGVRASFASLAVVGAISRNRLRSLAQPYAPLRRAPEMAGRIHEDDPWNQTAVLSRLAYSVSNCTYDPIAVLNRSAWPKALEAPPGKADATREGIPRIDRLLESVTKTPARAPIGPQRRT